MVPITTITASIIIKINTNNNHPLHLLGLNKSDVIIIHINYISSSLVNKDKYDQHSQCEAKHYHRSYAAYQRMISSNYK